LLTDRCMCRSSLEPEHACCSWWPQPRHHAAALPHPNQNHTLMSTVLQPTAEIRRCNPALTTCTVVPSRSRHKSGRTPLRRRIYLSGKRRENWKRESGELTVDLRWEKGNDERLAINLGEEKEEMGWHTVGLGVEKRKVGVVHRRQKIMTRKRNVDGNVCGGRPSEVSQNKLQQTKNSCP
jgi:hypothetical protein